MIEALLRLIAVVHSAMLHSYLPLVLTPDKETDIRPSASGDGARVARLAMYDVCDPVRSG